MRASSFVEPELKRKKLSLVPELACLRRDRTTSEKDDTSGTSTRISEELPVDDEWDDDFFFTQPEVLELVDASFTETEQEKEARRSTVRELCKPESTAFTPQFAVPGSVIPNGTAGASVAPMADGLMVSHQLTLDRISQDCSKYKNEIEELRRVIMTKEGEVKILREWKLNAEREELRRQSQAYAKQQLESRKMQELEQKHAKEIEALKTQLKFLELEKNSAEEKLLEERQCRRQSIGCQSVVSSPAELCSNVKDGSMKSLGTAASSIPFPDRRTFYECQLQQNLANRAPSIILPNKVTSLAQMVPPKAVTSSGVQTDKVLAKSRRKAALNDRLWFKKETFNLPLALLCPDGNADSRSSGATVGERLRFAKVAKGGILSRHERPFWI
ncbi:hypothetical protein M514_12790 [Trichuris suis]|uniref:Uncharacterized protein n=1 Tax=Trichuris suis TaxID=68888 RepID=A0A085LMZ3_9BILA|nr:hypothetical protein M513_12790 [Trichuris suis]KFD69073.1 hypothetical protein M514_12790 [Trichuris suis]KHJ42557.1 hypothetical protein D918_07275 [Trichuris suis]